MRVFCRKEEEKKKALKAVWLCLFWTIWWERTKRAFENCENVDQAIKYSFLYLFWDWVGVSIRNCSLSMLDFVEWLGSK